MNRLIEKMISGGSQRAAIFLRKKDEKQILIFEKFAQIGKISSGLIHDLTSPITALNLQMELLDENLARNPEFIMHIKEAVINVNNYSKIMKEYISGESKKESVILSKEIENAIKLISYKAVKESVQIQFIRNQESKIKINKIHIYQIIISLVSNAIEAFKKNNSNRKIIIKNEEMKNEIKISVTDFGRGIKYPQKIFKTFYTTKRNSGGIGIGLSTVKYIVEKELKGKIEVSSKINKGSTFEITIPKN